MKPIYRLTLLSLLLILVLLGVQSQSSPVQAAEPPARTVFVHLFEWKWSDIALECENFLGPMGFAAIQVSPPQEHRLIDSSESGDGTNYPWWERYQPISYQIESRSGTRAEFDDMVSRCQAVGVDIYVDAVINHMSGLPEGVCDTGSAGTTVCQDVGAVVASGYPNHYSTWDFHADPGATNFCDHGIFNWGSAWEVQNCELLSLDDLDTGEAYVQNEIADYLNDLVGNLGVAGFRIDAAKHMNEYELNTILGLVGGSPYVFQEVIQDSLTDGSNYLMNGDVTEFRYAQEIGNRFNYGSLNALQGLENWWLASQNAVVFTDNHDNQRGHGGGGGVITHEDPAGYTLANVFMLAYPYGYPKIMSSYHFSTDGQGPPSDGNGNTYDIYSGGVPAGCDTDWVCEHRWLAIANMVNFRNYTSDNFYVTDWWDNGNNQIAFGRGDAGFVVINREGYGLNRTFQTSLPAGDYCDVISGNISADGTSCTGSTITVNGGGTATINVGSMSAVAIHAGTFIGSSGGGGFASVHPQVYFRGTANGWATTAMTLVADYTWETTADFTGDPTDRFKFDIYGDWSYNFGDNDNDGYVDQAGSDIDITQGAGNYTITLNDQTGAYTVVKNGGGGGFTSVHPQVYFRGTANGWATTAMTLVADYTWETTVDFVGDPTDRFKFDIYGDWSYNFGDNNNDGYVDQAGGDIYITQGAGNYTITLNDQTGAYTVIKNGGALLTNWGQVYFRGTPNSWATTGMTLVADYTWETTVTFSGSPSDRFKFDVYGDWSYNFGDNNNDGYADQTGNDIYVTQAGTYLITFNEQTLAYSITLQP